MEPRLWNRDHIDHVQITVAETVGVEGRGGFCEASGGALAVFLDFVLVEDPPWEKEKQKRTRGVDYVGLALISLGLGCMQISLDRGEDDDWFGSRFIVIMATLAFIGIFGAICWLLTARKPIIDLDVFTDRNFAMGCVLVAAMGMLLYASAVLIPQFSQQELGYTALLSGLILSPGGIVIIMLILVVGRLMRFVPTRYIVMTGFTIMGCALMYSSRLTVSVDYWSLVEMRSAQTAALGFLFVPISTIAYLTLPQKYRSDGAALFPMFRNVGGAVGISVATALVTGWTEADQARLSTFMTPLNQGCNVLIQQSEATLRTLGRAADSVHHEAVSHTYRMYLEQAAVLAYDTVFQYSAALAFLVVPLCVFISGETAQGSAEGGH